MQASQLRVGENLAAVGAGGHDLRVVDGRRHELSANRYPGVIHPQGHRFLSGFRFDPFPVFTYDVEHVRLEEEYGYWWSEDTGEEAYRRHLRPDSLQRDDVPERVLLGRRVQSPPRSTPVASAARPA